MYRTWALTVTIVAVGLAASARPAVGHVGSWTPIAPTLYHHSGFGIATLPDGRIMAIAGGGVTTNVEAFTPSTNTWHALAPLPLPRWFLGAATAGGVVYAFGGYGSDGVARPATWAYNPATNSWRAVAPMPSGREGFGTAVSGGKIYVIGGWAAGERSARVFRYDPARNSWSSVAPLPVATGWQSAAADSSGRIYSFGGCCNANGAGTRAVYRYTPSSDRWRSVARLPTVSEDSRNDFTAAVLGSDGKIYVTGGGIYRRIFADVRIYNPSTNTWTMGASLPHAAQEHGMARGTDGSLYLVGGWGYDCAQPQPDCPLLKAFAYREGDSPRYQMP